MKLSSFGSLCGRSIAFTMAEILLSLTIIGVVAAITLPSLTGNINERTWNTQRKALYSRLSQAFSLIDNIRGYGKLVTVKEKNEWGDDAEYDTGNAAETFLSGGLSKVLKLNNICDSTHISDCGMPDQIVDLVGSKVNVARSSEITRLSGLHNAYSYYGCAGFKIDGDAAAFETANGESVMFWYNPLCLDSNSAFKMVGGYVPATSAMCANFLYDLNGKKGPNTVGKDVGFITVFYPADSVVVAPLPMSKNIGTGLSVSEASKACSAQAEDLRLPNKEEMLSMGLNSKFIGGGFPESDLNYLTSSYTDANTRSGGEEWGGLSTRSFVYLNDSTYGAMLWVKSKTTKGAGRCIKR